MQTKPTFSFLAVCVASLFMSIACDTASDTIGDVATATALPVATPSEPTNTPESVAATQDEDIAVIPTQHQAEIVNVNPPESTPTSTPTITPTPTSTSTPTATATPVLVSTLEAESSVWCKPTQCGRDWLGEEQLRLETGRYAIERSDVNCTVQFLENGGLSYPLSDLQPIFDRWFKTGIHTWRTYDEGCQFALYKYWNTEKPEPTATPVLTSQDEIWEVAQGVGSDHVCNDFAHRSLVNPDGLGKPISDPNTNLGGKFITYNTLARRYDLSELTHGEYWVLLFDNCQDYVPAAATATVVAESETYERQIWDLIIAPNTRYIAFRNSMCEAYDPNSDPEQSALDSLWSDIQAIENTGSVRRTFRSGFRFTIAGFHEGVGRNCGVQ